MKIKNIFFLSIFFLFSSCTNIFVEEENPLEKMQKTMDAMQEQRDEIPVFGFYGFSPVDIEENDLWIGDVATFGLQWRIQPKELQWGFASPYWLGVNLGTHARLLKNSPALQEVRILDEMLDMEKFYLGEYSFENDIVKLTIYIFEDDQKKKLVEESDNLENLYNLISLTTEKLINDLGVEKKIEWTEDQIPRTKEAMKEFAWASRYLDNKWYGYGLTHLKNLIELEPGFLPAYRSLLSIYRNQDNLDAAVDLLSDIKNAQNDPVIQDNIGKILFFKGDYENAEIAFKNSLSINPQNADAMYYLGKIAEAQGNEKLRQSMMKSFLDMGSTGGALQAAARASMQFSNSNAIITLKQRWKDRNLSKLPPGAYPQSVNKTLILIEEKALYDGGRIGFPTGVVSDVDGFWVSVHYNSYGEIIKFDWSGNIVTRVKEKLLEPKHLTFHENKLYISDVRKDLIYRLEGAELIEWSKEVNKVEGLTSSPYGIWAIDKKRSTAVLLDSDGKKIKVEKENLETGKIEKKTKQFVLKKKISTPFAQPTDIEWGKDNLFWIPDEAMGSIVGYDTDGTEVDRIGLNGVGPGELLTPHGITFSNGWTFVSDTGNSRIQAWDEDNVLRIMYGNNESFSNIFNSPFGVAVSSDQKVLAVTNPGSNRVLIFGIEDKN